MGHEGGMHIDSHVVVVWCINVWQENGSSSFSVHFSPLNYWIVLLPPFNFYHILLTQDITAMSFGIDIFYSV